MAKMAESNVNLPEETYYFKHCSLCSEDSDYKKAVKLCVDCKSYLCDECVKYHSKFPIFKSHKVLDDLDETLVEIATEEGQVVNEDEQVQNVVTGVRKVDLVEEDENVEFDYCTFHQGQVIDSYCKDHGDICCMVCVNITHRSCEHVLSLEEAAKGIHEKTDEVDEAKNHLGTLTSRLKLEKEMRDNNITQLDEQKLNILNEIDRFQENIIKKIAMMSEASREEVRSKHQELVSAVKKDVEGLEKLTSITEGSVETLNNSKDQTETKMFKNIKKNEKVANDAETLINDLPSKWPIRKLDYCIDYDSPHNDTSLQTFGHFIEDENNPSNVLRLSERYRGVFDVRLESDEKKCTVSGICVLENGMYCVSDFANRELKRFYSNFELVDNLELDGAPTSACLSGSQQVVVALRDEKLVQFISCSDTLSVEYSFPTENKCSGVFFDSGNSELFVCGGSSVCIYNKHGTLLKTIKEDETGKALFSDAKNCVMVPDTETIYSVDVNNGLIATDKDYKRIWGFTDTKLEKPWGICLIGNQHLFVACLSSCNILQIRKNGKFISVLLNEETEMGKLYTLAYDRRHSILMLGGMSNEIFTYHLCRKYSTLDINK